MFGKKPTNDVEKLARAVTPIGVPVNDPRKGGSPPTRLGETTLEFFKEGERHEAAGWTDTPLPPDDEPAVDPKIRFKSFDKIAKKRSSTVAVLVMAFGLVIAVAVGVIAALRTERALSSSLGSYFGFGGHVSGANHVPPRHPAMVPPLPDAGSPSPLPSP